MLSSSRPLHILVILTLVLFSACGGSSTSNTIGIIGTWRGVVSYDPSSCGPVELLSENIDGQEITIEITAPDLENRQCQLNAVDQDGNMYFHNFSSLEKECPSDEFLFALDETVTILEENSIPSGFLVQNITETSAIFSLSYFINRFCIVVFKGEFTRL